MLDKLFIQECELYWKLTGTKVLTSQTNRSFIRVNKVCLSLQNMADSSKIPVQFLVSVYAYFYVEVFKMNSFNMVQLKLPEFYAKINLAELSAITAEDTYLAYQIRDTWFTMNNKKTVSSLPFRVRPFYQKKHINVGVNTFFDKSFNFVYFSLVANFINLNRLNYPEMHGLVEFFFHLPIIRGPKVYNILNYTNPLSTMEDYYSNVYKVKDKNLRYSKFLTVAKSGIDYSELWCYPQLSKDIVNAI